MRVPKIWIEGTPTPWASKMNDIEKILNRKDKTIHSEDVELIDWLFELHKSVELENSAEEFMSHISDCPRCGYDFEEEAKKFIEVDFVEPWSYPETEPEELDTDEDYNLNKYDLDGLGEEFADRF